MHLTQKTPNYERVSVCIVLKLYHREQLQKVIFDSVHNRALHDTRN